MSHQAFSDIRPVPDAVRLSWPTPNYVDPVRRGPALVIVNGLLLPVAMIVVGLRLYTRFFVVRSAGLDDLFISLALLPALGLTIAVCLAATKYSWDVHIWDMPPNHIMPGRKVTFVAQFTFLWATNLTKMSILLFYRRMTVPGGRKTFNYAVWATMVFVICYTISMTIGLITSCTPVRSFWDITIPHTCIHERTFEMFAAVVNIVVDFVIIMLPLPTVLSLRLPKKPKRALIAVFLLGFCVCIAGIIRVYYVDLVENRTYDITWEGFILWIFVAVEVDVALICVSAPTLKPLFKRYFNSSTFHSSSHTRHFGGHTPRNPENNLEAGIRVPEPVELTSVEGQIKVQRQGKKIPTSKFNELAVEVKKTGEDSESEDSIFVLQQADRSSVRGNGESSRDGNRGNGKGCQVLNWARREPWSSV